jgi:hypothetical protein
MVNQTSYNSNGNDNIPSLMSQMVGRNTAQSKLKKSKDSIVSACFDYKMAAAAINSAVTGKNCKLNNDS